MNPGKTAQTILTMIVILYIIYIYILGGGEGPTPFFPKTHRNLDLGMGKNGEKSIWKEREKVFVYYYHCFLDFKQDFSCTMSWLWLLAANVLPVTSISTAHRNDRPLYLTRAHA